jgi:hypothetical protein
MDKAIQQAVKEEVSETNRRISDHMQTERQLFQRLDEMYIQIHEAEDCRSEAV